jgi:hypothetical protein
MAMTSIELRFQVAPRNRMRFRALEKRRRSTDKDAVYYITLQAVALLRHLLVR